MFLNFLFGLFFSYEHDPIKTTFSKNILSSNHTILQNTNRLINITCDELNYSSDFSVPGTQCNSLSGCTQGIYTTVKGSTVSYTFIGNKVHLVGYRTLTSTEAEIIIDSVVSRRVSFLQNGSQPSLDVIFSSYDLFPYGQHTITIKHSGTNGKPIHIINLYIDPFPKKLDYDGHLYENGHWEILNGIKYSNSSNAGLTFSFYGCRFWLTGVRSSIFGEFSLSIDYGTPITIRKRNTNIFAQNNANILYYQSEELDFSEHLVTITKTNYSMAINNLLFTIYPYSEIPNPIGKPLAIPISIPVFQMNITGNLTYTIPIQCSSHGLHEFCGLIYTTTNNVKSTFEYTFKGEKFQIFGQHGPSHGSYDLFVDDVYITSINQNRPINSSYILDYTSPIFPYGNHRIHIEGNAVFSIHKITFWPSIKAKRINITEFNKSNHTYWRDEWDQIGGIQQYTHSFRDLVMSAYIEKLKSNKIWLYGCQDPAHGDFEIHYGDSIVGQFSERYYPRRSFVLVYESPYFINQNKSFIINTRHAVVFNYIFYIDEEASSIPIELQPYPSYASNCSTLIPCSANITNYPCGAKCRNNLLEYTFKGECFQIVGSRNTDLGSYTIYFDDVELFTVNQMSNVSIDYYLDYTSKLYPYGEHHISINSSNVFEIFRIKFWPSIKAERLNVTSFTFGHQFAVESDRVGGVAIYSGGRNELWTNLTSSKFWIYGSKAYWMNIGVVNFGPIQNITFNSSSPERIDFVLLYESPTFPLCTDNFSILSIRTIYFNYIYYLGEPDRRSHIPTPTLPPIPTAPYDSSIDGSYDWGYSNTECHSEVEFDTDSGDSDLSNYSTDSLISTESNSLESNSQSDSNAQISSNNVDSSDLDNSNIDANSSILTSSSDFYNSNDPIDQSHSNDYSNLHSQSDSNDQTNSNNIDSTEIGNSNLNSHSSILTSSNDFYNSNDQSYSNNYSNLHSQSDSNVQTNSNNGDSTEIGNSNLNSHSSILTSSNDQSSSNDSHNSHFQSDYNDIYNSNNSNDQSHSNDSPDSDLQTDSNVILTNNSPLSDASSNEHGNSNDNSDKGSKGKLSSSAITIIAVSLSVTIAASIATILITLFSCRKPVPIVANIDSDEECEITDALLGIDVESSSSSEGIYEGLYIKPEF